MDEERASFDDVARFFSMSSKELRRSTRSALARLKVPTRGRTVAWKLVFEAIGLDGRISGQALQDVTRPMLTAEEVAARNGIDPETIYRWHRENKNNLPRPVRLGPRGMRWLRAEIEGWEGIRDPVEFPRAPRKAAPFGAIKPNLSQ